MTDDAETLARAVRAVEAPDVVMALSRDGTRTVVTGGTASASDRPVPRAERRYEIGSASKTFTGLLLADLAQEGVVRYEDRAAALLGGRGHRRADRTGEIALFHLVTHTSGLPALPADFYPGALPHWSTDPYAHYSAERVVRAFLRARPRHRPGTRWHYSNFGVSVLGPVLAAATGTSWEELVTVRVLRPLGLTGTSLCPGTDGADATGHRHDGVTPVPPLDIGGFRAAGAIRATPADLLTFLEAHLAAALPSTRTPLGVALAAVRRPVLRRGLGHRHTHTLTWFQHPSDQGPVYFHAGATTGQQAFVGFCPASRTAVAALATRKVGLRDTFVATAYGLLTAAPVRGAAGARG